MATSLQSKVTGSAGVAPETGEIRDGADNDEPEVLTVSTTVLVTPAKAAEMLAEVDAVTELVVTVKLALLLPAGTVTLAGTVTADELSESDITAPPVGAAALKVTVPVEELPPITLDGLRETVLRVAVAALPNRNVNGADHSPKLPARSAA